MHKQISIEEIIKRLGTITEAIDKIYTQLIYEENEEEIKKLHNHLDIVLNIENELYDTIFKHKEYDKGILIKIPGIIYSLCLKNPNPIIARISNYITQIDYINPFISTLGIDIYRQQENYIYIKFQSILDLYKSIQITLDNIINTTSSKEEKTNAKEMKNAFLFNIKLLSNFISASDKTNKLYGKERCILFGHDEKIVNQIYQAHIYDKINESIINILILGNSLKDKVILESSLNLLNKAEVFNITREYYKLSNKESPELTINPNNEIVIKILNKALSGIIDDTLRPKKKYKS